MDEKTYEYMTERTLKYDDLTKRIKKGQRLLKQMEDGYCIEVYGNNINHFLVNARVSEVKRRFAEIIKQEIESIEKEREEI